MQERVAGQSLEQAPSLLQDELYFYGGKIHPHYGHFILSTLSRFWPYAYKNPPRIKILMHEETSVDQWFTLPHLAQSFTALGIEKTDFVNINQVTKVKQLLVADPAFIEEFEVYKAFADLGHYIGDCITGSPPERNKRPIYLTKSSVSSGVWHFVNENELAKALESHGFDIVCPETLSFAEQIKLFRTRLMIVGTMSSHLHTSIFSATQPTIIGLNFNESARTNYTLINDINKTSNNFYFPKGMVTDVGPSTSFTVQYRLNDPHAVAAAIVNLVKTKTQADPIEIAARTLGLQWPLPAIGMDDFDWTHFEHNMKVR
jgi:capsular polysaccharide biosynthesis protein